MNEMLNKMAERCWKTAIARFESARRMKRCHNASTLCIAMLSLEIIIINLLIFINPLELNDVVITITTVCLSMFVLVLSLIVSHLKYEKREEQYHECGLELSNLETDIKIYLTCGEEISHEILKYYNNRYNSILQKWNLNHSDIDFEWAIYKNDKLHKKTPENINWRRNKLLEVKWHLLRSDSIYHLLTVLGFIAIIFIAAYSRPVEILTEDSKNPSVETQNLQIYKDILIGDTISNDNNMCRKIPMQEDAIVRLSKIKVNPDYFDEYMKYAIEVGTVSLETEPGVLTMYAVADKENLCNITILETYASQEAYKSHIASEHFQKYKQGTLHMVDSLLLDDVIPFNPDNRIINFINRE